MPHALICIHPLCPPLLSQFFGGKCLSCRNFEPSERFSLISDQQFQIFFSPGSSWIPAVPPHTTPPTQPQQSNDGPPWTGRAATLPFVGRSHHSLGRASKAFNVGGETWRLPLPGVGVPPPGKLAPFLCIFQLGFVFFIITAYQNDSKNSEVSMSKVRSME